MTKKIDQTGIYASATNGQLYIGSTGAVPVLTTLTQGSNVTITNGAGSITIAASGGGSGATTLLNYNGTGTPAIRSSTNVSSVTYSSAGKYIVNFTSSYGNANYTPILTISNSASTLQSAFIDSLTAIPATGNIHVEAAGSSAFDNDYFTASIYT